MKTKLNQVYNDVSLGVRNKAAEMAGVSLSNFLRTDNETTINSRIGCLVKAQTEHVRDAQAKLNRIKVVDYEIVRGH